MEIAATVRLTRHNGRRPGRNPIAAVKWLLESWRAKGAVERDPLVVRHAGLCVRVAVEDALCLLGADVTGNEDPTGTVVLAAGQEEAARSNLFVQELAMGGTRLLDDGGWLQVRRLQDVDHRVDVS
jgi:hypothetical protein